MVDEHGDEVENFVACRNCFNVYKYVNCTSNLVKHKCYAKENGTASEQNVEVDSDTKAKLSDAVAKWLVANCRPTCILDDFGLKAIARMLLSIGAVFGDNVNIESIMPKQDAVEASISELYESQAQSIAEQLRNIKGGVYSITCCLWTDSYLKHSYIAVTVHYVRQSTMVSRLLAVSTLRAGKHTQIYFGPA
ncbi:hypothetical protein KR222_006538, partial [Zaprionus bogoriensis]